jgi:hypothetical protein
MTCTVYDFAIDKCSLKENKKVYSCDLLEMNVLARALLGDCMTFSCTRDKNPCFVACIALDQK